MVVNPGIALGTRGGSFRKRSRCRAFQFLDGFGGTARSNAVLTSPTVWSRRRDASPRHAEGAGNTVFPPEALPAPVAVSQAQLDPTALSVLDMLLPAVCTFWPWALACS